MRRTSTGGSTTATTVNSIKAPYWVKLVRAGNTITMSYSANGTSWTVMGSQSVTMGSTVYVGLAVTSKKTSVLATATFDNVSVA
jgi:regulation of enolase protein 1 (concanavalin A-like superfamily)